MPSNSKQFECEVCKKVFCSSQAKNNHVIVIHKNAGRYSCEFCEKTFQGKCGLAVHRRIHTGEMPFVCKQCPKKFNNRGNFKRHVLDCHSERKFECSKCGKKFGNRSSLNAHIKTHTDRYKCESCGDLFKRPDALRGHQKLHSAENPFVCDWPGCGASYKQKQSLYGHSRLHYADPDDLKCKVCGRTFTQKSSVNLHHRLVHSDLFPYPCTECNKNFRVRQDLTAHLLAVHQIEQETGFQCKIADCKKYFMKHYGLRKHFPIHALQWPFNCYLCLVYFETEQELDDHKREQGHTGEVRAIKLQRQRQARGKRRPPAARPKTGISESENDDDSGDSVGSDGSDGSDDSDDSNDGNSVEVNSVVKSVGGNSANCDSTSHDPVDSYSALDDSADVASEYNLRRRGKSVNYRVEQDEEESDSEIEHGESNDEMISESDEEENHKKEPDEVGGGRMANAETSFNVTKVKIERERSPPMEPDDLSDLVAAKRRRAQRESDASDGKCDSENDKPANAPENGIGTSCGKLKLVYDVEYRPSD